MDDQRSRLISEMTKVLDDPKLASLTNEEKAVQIYDEVLEVEFNRINDAWTRLMFVNSDSTSN